MRKSLHTLQEINRRLALIAQSASEIIQAKSATYYVTSRAQDILKETKTIEEDHVWPLYKQIEQSNINDKAPSKPQDRQSA